PAVPGLLTRGIAGHVSVPGELQTGVVPAVPATAEIVERPVLIADELAARVDVELDVVAVALTVVRHPVVLVHLQPVRVLLHGRRRAVHPIVWLLLAARDGPGAAEVPVAAAPVVRGGGRRGSARRAGSRCGGARGAGGRRLEGAGGAAARCARGR